MARTSERRHGGHRPALEVPCNTPAQTVGWTLANASTTQRPWHRITQLRDRLIDGRETPCPFVPDGDHWACGVDGLVTGCFVCDVFASPRVVEMIIDREHEQWHTEHGNVFRDDNGGRFDEIRKLLQRGRRSGFDPRILFELIVLVRDCRPLMPDRLIVQMIRSAWQLV